VAVRYGNLTSNIELKSRGEVLLNSELQPAKK